MIYYLVPDYSEPSWGVGMLYEHVRLLSARGWPACVLHHEVPFRLTWREPDVPVRYLDAPDLAPTAADVVVVPEVLAASAAAHRFPWRKVVFVQGGFLIVRGLGEAPDYRALGYEMAMAVLPHVVPVVERHFGIAARVVPPFVAPYFFGGSGAPRERRVLLVDKEGYRVAGYPDAEIAGMLLDRELATRPGWQLSRLGGLAHRQVAELMQRSLYLVNVCSLETFNATVPEAMAAGCVPICYEAVGGRDFLRNGENAIVFANHEVYALVERVCQLVDHPADHEPLLEHLRAGGQRTVATFCEAATADALARFFTAGARPLAPWRNPL